MGRLRFTKCLCLMVLALLFVFILVMAQGERPSAASKKEPIKYHVLINSYMNSGSRFTGSFFGFRKNSFYFYEPLWLFSTWDYYKPPDRSCCSVDGPSTCGRTTVDELNKYKVGNRTFPILNNIPKNTAPIDMLTGILDDIYNCNLSRLENLVVKGVQEGAEFGGPSWSNYRHCTRTRVPKIQCIQHEEKVCREAAHVVIKVLRLTTSSLEPLLEKHSNLKIIHLFRDPRAIINSRQESKGYPSKNVDANSRNLCTKMLLDYEGGLILQKKFPDRFKFVFYEDIRTNVTAKMQVLYDFAGMSMDIDELETLNVVKTNVPNHRMPSMMKARATDNSNWWRNHLSFVIYRKVQDNCKEIAKLFNLTKFKDRREIMKLNIPSMRLPESLMIS